jgi:hypothetical protein
LLSPIVRCASPFHIRALAPFVAACMLTVVSVAATPASRTLVPDDNYRFLDVTEPQLIEPRAGAIPHKLVSFYTFDSPRHCG